MAATWLVHAMRLSLFSTGTISPSEEYWQLVSGQPEAENRSAVPGGKQYWGKHLNGLLQLTIAGNRLDLVLSSDPEARRDDHLPVVDTWSTTSASFLQAARSLLADLKFPVNRMAFGGHFLEPSPSRETSYRRLSEITKSLKLDFSRARDVIFRVNWPVESKTVSGLSLNRIALFGSMAFSRMVVQGLGTQVTFVVPTPESLVHAASIELDHNTPQEYLGSFEKQQIIPIFTELVALAIQNLEVGEVI